MSDARRAHRGRLRVTPIATAVASALTAFCLVPAPRAHAQALGDLAHREAERQARIVAHGWVYNDLSLEPAQRTRPGPEHTESPAPMPSEDSTLFDPILSESDESVASDVSALPGGRTEEQWRTRSESLQSRITGLEANREALQTNLKEIHRLAANSSLDGSVVADREAARVRALLDRISKDLSMLQEAWTRLEEDAMRHAVPPSWIQPADE